MRSFRRPALFLMLVIALSGPARAENSEAAKAGTSAGWKRAMQAVAGELSRILTDVSSDARFNNPEIRRELGTSVTRLGRLSHDLGRKIDSPDADPSVAIFGIIFADEAAYADRLLRTGHEAYAREILRSLPGYCIACHTRTGSGPTFTDQAVKPSVAALSPSERGDFFAASRQYDRALEEYEHVMTATDSPRRDPLGWAAAIRYSLGIAVRVKKDPVLAGRIVDRIIDTPGSAFYLVQDALKWRESIKAWKAETGRETLTVEGQHAEAIRLLALAHEQQRFPADRSADISYLRASAAIHALLQQGVKSPYAGEAYLMAGMCYDVLRSWRLGELHEIYYEACVRNSPHTPLSESCFQRFQQAAYEGFSGSGGLQLPDDVREKLAKLEALARVPAVPAVAPNH